MRYLEHRNPNHDALVVPTQEGATEDDTYFGSIGDATAKHVSKLSHAERQLWEEMIHMRSGAMFRPAASTQSLDLDPLNLKGEDLKRSLEEYKNKVSKESLEVIQEAFEQEQFRRVQSEDVYDQGNLIPYNQWVQNPQMWNSIDMPTTPKDKMLYQGNTSQPFYDAFPEGHSDGNFINQVLVLVDREWYGDKDDQKYADWIIQKRINSANIRPSTCKYLTQMVEALALAEQDSNDIVEKYLGLIDSNWSKHYCQYSKTLLYESEMYQLFLTNAKAWKQKAKSGIPIYKEIKKFGRILFGDKYLRKKMNNVTWSLYGRLKAKYAPKIIFQSYDLNRCSLQELRNILNLSDTLARKMWLSRPFESLQEVRTKGYITNKSYILEENAVKTFDIIQNLYDSSISSKRVSNFLSFSKRLNQLQKESNLSSDQWSLIWNYYKLLKSELLSNQKNLTQSKYGNNKAKEESCVSI